ncbi:hypothetical protein PENSPDRAFT_576375 [Peniophora sp. CONT]|nr:hypothetical protein PENSPDRAFT_576375 [Peniophora sp. CONT]
MSRLIVKNLPVYVTPERLQQHFTQAKAPSGTITDVKVAHKRDGSSRRFGFVGFKSDAEAKAAQAWFDKTFIDSARVRVEVVDGAKDAPAPRPNKRPRLDSDAPPEAGPSTVKKPAEKKSGKESQFDAFMDVMQPKARTGPAWANDEPAQPKPAKAKKQSEPAEGEDVQVAEGLSDLEWMRRRMTQGVEAAGQDKAFEQDEDDAGGSSAEDGDVVVADAAAKPAQVDSTRETILQTGRLFVRNLAFSCTEAELRDLFSQYGELSQVHLPVDPATKRPKGLAYVRFAKPEDAMTAYDALDKRSFQGRLLHILGAVDRHGNLAVESADGKKKTLKDERDDKRKSGAAKEFNWSMLYMNSDAVISSVADRMNLSKSDILDPSSTNAAVKLALAETHVISETKSYLEQEGVDLDSFASRARSDTIILVKNIPYGTTADSLREMFEPHGNLTRVLVPPAGTMAVIEFEKADEARTAFRSLAYRRLGNSVIYLEKGPANMFKAKPTEKAAPTVGAKPIAIADSDETEPDLAAGTTLFVKNLSFATTSDRLVATFSHLPDFAFARVQMKPDPKRPGAKLSMGYGFVGFKTVEGAKRALKGMHGHVLDGHALSVRFAGRGADEESEEKKGEKKSSTKMLVKNLPFEATRKDVRELFSAHGQLKSVRVPKRFDRRTRGFAFLEFSTKHEAESAYNALKHTHLLGRHLVLEWADEGEVDIEELRRKVGVGLGDGGELPGKKRKLKLVEDADEVDDE